MNSKTKTPKVRKKTNKNKLKPFVLVFIVVFLYVGIVSVKREIEIFSNKQKLAEIEEQIKAEEQRKEKLDSKLKIVDTPEYLEKLAREKLGYARSNEIIYYDASLKK